MSWPAGVLTRTVEIDTSYIGPAKGTGSYTFSLTRILVWTATGEQLVPGDFSVELTSDGMGSIDLPHNGNVFEDGSGNVITGWTWMATPRVVGARLEPFYFELAPGVGSVDLNELQTADPGTPIRTAVNFARTVTVNNNTLGPDVDGDIDLGVIASIGSSGDWADITNKPSTFPPSSHTHAESEVINLVSDLAGKAAASHTHAQSEVTGLVAALAAKADDTDLADVAVILFEGDARYTNRPATTRPVFFFGIVAPTNDGLLTGGGGAVPGKDTWFERVIQP